MEALRGTMHIINTNVKKDILEETANIKRHQKFNVSSTLQFAYVRRKQERIRNTVLRIIPQKKIKNINQLLGQIISSQSALDKKKNEIEHSLYEISTNHTA